MLGVKFVDRSAVEEDRKKSKKKKDKKARAPQHATELIHVENICDVICHALLPRLFLQHRAAPAPPIAIGNRACALLRCVHPPTW